MEDMELVSVGKIIGTHGYRGLLKLRPLTDFPERFNELERVILDTSKIQREVHIQFCQHHKRDLLIKLAEIDNLDLAREVQGALIKITPDQLYPLPEGYYYHFQLLGLQVEDVELGNLGKIKDILETGANDVYVIDSQEYGEILIPAIKEVILAVDLEQNKMQVRLLPGLIPSK
ncbi:MAG: 16S rRNA processing protein RimM [Syntrophomonadaceae bacterium]|jgi:16S rRNA processing protein RimM|nr:16S rRNA processing protein RimM [Syntrophomonadaceae bacterium]